MPTKQAKAKNGTLIVIGGREDKVGKMAILSEIACMIGKGPLCIATVASTQGDELWKEYHQVFKRFGVRSITHLDLVKRKEKVDQKALRAVKNAKAVFFTGGDQLKITSELGGTIVAERIGEIYREGGLIAGTSAGASVMGETMLVSGSGERSYRIGTGLKMAPGLGLVKEMLIDQHFAERGRIGRLIGAIAHNPKFLGIGLDENTAIIIESRDYFRVIGNGAVYVLDAHEATHCNISEAEEETTLSLFNVKFHLLGDGDAYDIANRKPLRPKAAEMR